MFGRKKKKMSFDIAGTCYYQEGLEKAIKDICTKQDLKSFPLTRPAELIPEKNSHDSYAIKVVFCGQHIGYVPRVLTTDVKDFISDGKYRAEATVFVDEEQDDQDIEAVLKIKKI